MSGPIRDRLSRGWKWLWRDASGAERVVVVVAILAVLVAVAFTVSDAVGGGGVCHCGP